MREYCVEVARTKKAAHREEDYWGKPVPGFGDPAARLLVLGLAPAAHGANRTGRLFTGDSSGEFLMRALHRAGFANLANSERADDGLRLRDAFISAAARCAPPDNKPAKEELAACLGHLDDETRALPELRVIVALGRIAFDAWLAIERRRGRPIRPRPVFAHAAVHDLSSGLALVSSYHPSRQNTNTGRLTETMFEQVFLTARRILDGRS